MKAVLCVYYTIYIARQVLRKGCACIADLVQIKTRTVDTEKRETLLSEAGIEDTRWLFLFWKLYYVLLFGGISNSTETCISPTFISCQSLWIQGRMPYSSLQHQKWQRCVVYTHSTTMLVASISKWKPFPSPFPHDEDYWSQPVNIFWR